VNPGVNPATKPALRPAAGRAWIGASAGAALVVALVGVFLAGRACAPSELGPASQVRGTPGVVLAIRDVARLEATSFHIEKVIEARDEQSRLWGLVQTRDALLLVAVGDVVAGVDLAKMRDDDASVDPTTHALRLRLPAPEVTSSTLDDRATHVYARTTDVLADRNEQLEGTARRSAEEQMRKLAIEEGILERARASADRTLRALLRPLGYEKVDIVWADRPSG
jgi:hypothetical protein